MDAEVQASLPDSHNPHTELSQCVIMKDTIRVAAISIIANTSSCLNDKIEEAENYLIDIYVRATLAIDKIKDIKLEGDECVKNVNGGIGEITAGLACVAKATGKGSLVLAETIPAVSVDIAKLMTEISSLQTTLPVCMSKNALLTLAEEAEAVVLSIKDCIKEKIDGSKAVKCLKKTRN